MGKMLLLCTCLVLGAVLRRTKYFDENSPKVLNNLIIYFFIPIITLHHIPKITFGWQLLWLSITPFLVYLSSFVWIKLMSLVLSIEKKTEGALIMCSGIGSISFVGFPIFEMLYGAEGLSYGIVLSLAGTFLVFNTVGISTGLHYANNGESSRSFLKKIITFPPMLAFLLAILINISQISCPEPLAQLLTTLTAPFSVIALLAIGMQIDFKMDSGLLKAFSVGQFHKLIVAPIVVYVFLWHIVGTADLVARICVLGAAIGSMNAISILAAQLDLNPKLAILMPAIGIPVSIPILFFIDSIL